MWRNSHALPLLPGEVGEEGFVVNPTNPAADLRPNQEKEKVSGADRRERSGWEEQQSSGSSCKRKKTT